MIVFEKVTKRYQEGVIAVSDLSLSVNRGEILVLLGRSGCGKTTALRLANRLIEPTSGTIYFQGEDIQQLDPISLRRKIGYAIQHIGLFLHMTVEENIGIVPKLLGWSEEEISKRVDDLLTAVGLAPQEYRKLYPAKLSGGQKQRIGVARALAADPPVILMDEPFGALDPLMREQVQNQFLEIQSKIRKTVLFVTHDLSEAVKMGDRIAVFEEGKVVQIATPHELLMNPQNDFINQFLGKERVQLLMQIHTLEIMRPFLERTTNEVHPKISLNSSLMEALTAVKLTGAQKLSIHKGDQWLGYLGRKQLLEGIIECL